MIRWNPFTRGGAAREDTPASPADPEPRERLATDVPGDAPARLVLYTRAGCHLCEEADRLLTALSTRTGHALRRVDVDALDAEERARLTDLVPVVCVDNREVARWRVDPARVQRALEGR